MSKLYPVQEIGSLAKPRWRTKGLTQPLSSKDLVEAEEWAQRPGIPDFQDRAKQLLAAQEQNNRVRELLELSTIYGLRLFEQTGLDNVGVGGEQQRVEMDEQVLRPEIRDLVDAGAEWIQIDEPAITTHPEPADMDLFVEGWNETVRGFNCKFSDHTCYPSEIGYKVLSQYAPKLDKCTHLALEFANRTGTNQGVDTKK